jgi:hypothetical protein
MTDSNASERLRVALGLDELLQFNKGGPDAEPSDLIELAEIHIKGAHNTMVDSFSVGQQLGQAISRAQALLAAGEIPEEVRPQVQSDVDEMQVDLQAGMDTAEGVASLQGMIGRSLLELARTKLLSRDLDVRHAIMLASNDVQPSDIMFGGMASDFLADGAQAKRDADDVNSTLFADNPDNPNN